MCLQIIMNRFEFELENIGFDEKYGYLLEDASKIIFKKTETHEELAYINLKLKGAKLYHNCLQKIL